MSLSEERYVGEISPRNVDFGIFEEMPTFLPPVEILLGGKLYPANNLTCWIDNDNTDANIDQALRREEIVLLESLWIPLVAVQETMFVPKSGVNPPTASFLPSIFVAMYGRRSDSDAHVVILDFLPKVSEKASLFGRLVTESLVGSCTGGTMRQILG